METPSGETQLLVRLDRDLKRRLRAKLALEDKTFKGWVEEMARQYLGDEPPTTEPHAKQT